MRFYTYSSTLLLALEAAAEAGIELVVLDRPNPLGGVRVAGPPSAPRDVVPASFVNLAPGPLVHGLTAGEMARYANSRLARPARLTVIEMTGWRRDMTWRDTGRAWVPPSPNLRTPEAALAYPGLALLEGTNVSEGRGTDAPFLLFGAPWLDPEGLRLEVPGYRFGPARFTPRSSPAAPRPKYEGVECRGLRIEIDDPRAADPVRLGLSLLSQLSRQSGFEWTRGGEALTWLTGTPRVRGRASRWGIGRQHPRRRGSCARRVASRATFSSPLLRVGDGRGRRRPAQGGQPASRLRTSSWSPPAHTRATRAGYRRRSPVMPARPTTRPGEGRPLADASRRTSEEEDTQHDASW